MSAPEKRKFARLDMALTVGYTLQNTSGGPSERAEAVSADVSAGGLRLMTPGPIPNGSHLALEIFLGNAGVPVQVTGEVVWQNKLAPTSYETGVIIQQMDVEDKKRLMQFIFDQMARLIGLPAA